MVEYIVVSVFDRQVWVRCNCSAFIKLICFPNGPSQLKLGPTSVDPHKFQMHCTRFNYWFQDGIVRNIADVGNRQRVFNADREIRNRKTNCFFILKNFGCMNSDTVVNRIITYGFGCSNVQRLVEPNTDLIFGNHLNIVHVRRRVVITGSVANKFNVVEIEEICCASFFKYEVQVMFSARIGDWRTGKCEPIRAPCDGHIYRT